MAAVMPEQVHARALVGGSAPAAAAGEVAYHAAMRGESLVPDFERGRGGMADLAVLACLALMHGIPSLPLCSLWRAEGKRDGPYERLEGLP